ncbi:SH2 domain-containing protein 4B isoform X2 [Lingula anatina]|nr:SH2 domain-containing protein 4B isoform X2 [Lingula anatina]XP_013419417.1 SH2 domain-containing protein 4B isoform X2 [Lingula anatina]XP_013419418.1 SH2 domain-containing protein 4B isoform X2 [Lingula anatina]|eukprot:XP_013419416.1 SH2 domain-containing protein 4B isoform X2 [Lingula anatina]
MGEHPDDKTIEQIIEEETIAKAAKLAEQEAEELRRKEEEEIKLKMKEEQERLEKKLQEEEAEMKRKQEEAALYQSLKEARLAAEKLEAEKVKIEKEEKAKLAELKPPASNGFLSPGGYATCSYGDPFDTPDTSAKAQINQKQSEEKAKKMRERRSSELYMSFREARKKFEKMAEESGKVLEAEWEEQEKKAKEAEKDMREIARRAREEHRRSTMSLTHEVIDAFTHSLQQQSIADAPPVPDKNTAPSTNNNLPPTKKSRPPRPMCKNDVIEWFKNVERIKGSGIDPLTGKTAEWFHGVISRQDAEDLLRGQKVGTYLVRVSEKVWGYTISYKAIERCKHFLIDTLNDGTYQFFGSNQLVHKNLADMIEFHKTKPISGIGKELLLHPCKQKSDPPDYAELFQEEDRITTFL